MIESGSDEFEGSIPDLFEEHVRNYPGRLAFKNQQDALTWDDLNRRANRIARAILARCDARQRPVAVLLDQGASIMAAIMGILKSGGFYVLLNRSHPQARNIYILGDTEAPLIVTDGEGSAVAATLVTNAGVIINIDALDGHLSTDNLGLRISPDSPIHISYTSGTTGEPKGVVSTHRRILHKTTLDRRLQLGPDDRLTNAGSAERNTLTAMMNGAGTFPWNVKGAGLARLGDWLVEQEITVYRSVPSVFRHFAATPGAKRDFPKLRLIILTGEPIYKSDVDLYKAYFPDDCVLAITYAALEAGPIRQYVIDKETKISGVVVPVGYEIPDKQVVLLDGDHKPVAPNEVGEIAVRSRYLPLGYWRKPELTKLKYLPDPDGGEERICLTGDIGRMLPDGCLEHLGRSDFQVKIRGLRVEIAAIEGMLRSMPSIGDATVIPRDDQRGDKVLVAYLVPSPRASLNVSQIRKSLAEKLPDFMVPSRFVVLDALPLTPSGKVDLQALPTPGRGRPEIAIPFVAPNNPIEKILAVIWCEVLSLDQTGIHDNFLDLGGNSLLAARVISRILQVFRIELPLRALFDAPTIAATAEVIVRHHGLGIGQADLSGLLLEVESLSDDDARRLLARAREE